MLQKIKANPHLHHFLLYTITFGLYGYVIAVPGPVIPFMAEKYSLPETSFIFMFWTRASGFVAGGFLTKVLTRYYSHHKLIFLSMKGCGVFFMLFPFTFSMPLQGFEVFAAATCCSAFEIILLQCFYEAFKGNEEQYWLQLSLVPFGVCALLCPILVGFIGEMSYFVVGILFALLAYGFLALETPEKLTHAHLGASTEAEKGIRTADWKTEAGLAFMIFFYFAQETGFGGWISSYSVMKGAFQKEGSAFLASLFWSTMTVFRFINTSRSGTISQKLMQLFELRALSIIILTIFSTLNLVRPSAILGCILMGISYSSTYALVLTLPLQYKRKLTPNQTANITICGTMGQGLLTTSQGYIMKYFGPNSFYPWMALIGFANFLVLRFTMSSLEADQDSSKEGAIEKELLERGLPEREEKETGYN